MVLERLSKGWKAPVYALYRTDVDVVQKGDRIVHRFHCAGPGCDHIVNRYIDGNDATSTSSLRTHIGKCAGWGPDILKAIDKVSTRAEALQAIQKVTRGEATSITVAFERTGKGKVTYSTRPLTKSETRSAQSSYNSQYRTYQLLCRAGMVRWCAESLRPFAVASDSNFLFLMKTGRPSQYVPSPTTVSRDTRRVFKRVRTRIAQMLQVRAFVRTEDLHL